MSDNDLIRRKDAIAIMTGLPVFSEHASDVENAKAVSFIHKATTTICALPAVQVTVKPLEWFEVEKSRHGGKYTADGYTIRYIEGLWLLDFAGDTKSAWRFIDLASAKAAAQADYDARIRFALTVTPALISQPSPDEHYDEYCIRQFAKLMSEKMAASRAKGRSGWYDPEQCSVEYLRTLLYEHLDKGDPVDVANFCMMLRHYEASTYRDHCNCKPAPDAAKVAALVEAADYLLRVAEHLMQDRFHTLIDVRLMVKASAKIQSMTDARAAIAAMKDGE